MERKKVILLAQVGLVLLSVACFGHLDAKPHPILSGVVNLNTATAGELTLLPGIGPAKAQAIISFRQEHPFKGVEELTEIRGIGPKILEKLVPYLTITEPTTLQQIAVVDNKKVAK